MSFPTLEKKLPWIIAVEMVEVDRAMVEDFQIGILQMMENAGRSLATLARERFLAGDPSGSEVSVLAGTGGNGSGALVAARRLHGWGARVKVLLARREEELGRVASQQLGILRRIGVEIAGPDQIDGIEGGDLVIDGILGYSILGPPHGSAAELIQWTERQRAPVLALDLPSGLDPTTGAVYEPTIRAAATLTLALPKKGLGVEAAKEWVGELYLADIGVPPELYVRTPLRLDIGPIFAAGDILRLC